MQFAIFRAPVTSASAQPRLAPGVGPDAVAPGKRQCLKFGSRYFVYAADDAPRPGSMQLADATIEKEAALERRHIDTLHLVTQQGRLFQKRFPDVPILLDAGRHLLISADPGLAAKLAASSQPGFKVEPVTGDEDVFVDCPCPSPRPEPDPSVLRVVDRLSPVALKAGVTTLATYPTRNSLTRHYADAAAWAADRLMAMGYATTMWGFDIAGSATYPAGRSLNVIADKQGTGPGERALVLVVAHLDSVNHEEELQQGLGAAAPGADDNASGSVGLLEMARVFHDLATEHDLRFILFGGEEQDLLGSAHYVKRLSARDRARITAVLNMDMIAVDNQESKPPAVLLEGGPVSETLIEELCAAAHAYTRLDVKRTLKPWGSDHVSFLTAGIASVLTIEGYDRSNERVHSARDMLDFLDYRLAIDILRMNTAFVAKRAGLVAAPTS